MRLLLNWLLSAVALLIVSYLVPGFHVEGFKEALIAAIVIGLINATLGFLLKLITLPLTVLTLGVFWWVVNAFMLILASKFLAPGSADSSRLFWEQLCCLWSTWCCARSPRKSPTRPLVRIVQ